MCGALAYVRFGPKADIRVFLNSPSRRSAAATDTNYRPVVAMTPLPYAIERRANEMSADEAVMKLRRASAMAHVCSGPKADIL